MRLQSHNEVTVMYWILVDVRILELIEYHARLHLKGRKGEKGVRTGEFLVGPGLLVTFIYLGSISRRIT